MRRKKLTFKVKTHLFVSTEEEFTLKGTSGSPWFKNGVLDKQIGIHVGGTRINRGGNKKEIVNRITRALFDKILRHTGMGKNERNDKTAGTSTTNPADNDDAMHDEYSDHIDEDEEKYDDYYDNYYQLINHDNEKYQMDQFSYYMELDAILFIVLLFIMFIICFMFGIFGVFVWYRMCTDCRAKSNVM